MPAPLLETKLFIPTPRKGLVPRPRLRERLAAGAAGKLMLVSAPAGFGKTTLLAEWFAAGTSATAGERSVAWLSLDRGDNDPTLFWAYVIAALRTAVPDVGANELVILTSPHPPPIHRVLTSLLNDLGALDRDIVLVLDDYHLIDAPEVHDAITFLLDHTPPRLHVVIASRADPAMPLARLRARGELVEIRAAELRFTADEVAAYLNEGMGLQLNAHDVAALEERTEGWIAALQLAALSMQGRDDVAGFIAGFAGDDRYIVDYLVEEVLHRQAEPVRDFLLRTSILGRLTGSLCDAVTGGAGSKSRLEALDRGNLFVVPLDDQRQWYRYHHLFADVLKARLADDSPDLVQELHRRACDWYAENGEVAEATEHAIAGAHVERAADLIELALPALRRDRQEVALRGWLDRLPDDVIAVRPVLSNGYAGALLSTGHIEGVERHLRDAERWLDMTEAAMVRGHMVVADDEEFRRLPAAVAVHRAGLSLVTGDPVATVSHARRAQSLLEQDDHLGHAAANALMGLAFWSTGDLESAREVYERSLGSMQAAGHLADVLGLCIALGDIQITQGRLHDAVRTYEQALRLAPDHGVPLLRGTADMYVGLSALHRERNDLAAARQLLERSKELGEHMGLPQNPYRWRVSMSRLEEAEGDLAGAVDLLDEAERVYVGDFSPNVRPVPAVRARAWIKQGRLEDVFGWVHGRGLSVDDELTYPREYEHVTLARALLAQPQIGRSLDEAAQLLERLLRAATDGQRTGTVIEILVLQALALRLRGEMSAALVPLERALSLAEPEDYVWMFVDEGAPMTALLQAVVERETAPAYVARLLAACGKQDRQPAPQGLIDPLSERELDVLRLLGTDLSGPEIAGELVVSLNTVRTHTKNIYAKLGVNSRRAAARRGEELGLMSRSRR